ncbi:MAG: M23 family metallopeptidase [Bdellovibrionota bacterium]
MANRFYTFMLIPERSSQVKKWMVSQKTVHGALIGLAVFLVFVIFSTVVTINHFVQKEKFDETSLRNQYLESQLHFLQNKVNLADSTLVRIQNFEQKLRVITQINTQTQTGGVGIGPISNEDESLFKNSGLDQSPMLAMVTAGQKYSGIESLELNVDQVHKKAALQEQSLQELYELLKDQHSLLSSTPSVAPVRGIYTSGFGYRISPFTGSRSLHTGIDLSAPIGTPVRSPADGVVTKIENDAGYGKVLVISHGYGFSTLYGHNSKILVKVGQKVKRGEQISEVGNTGRSTGPHLHYEVRVNGVEVNPTKYILN